MHYYWTHLHRATCTMLYAMLCYAVWTLHITLYIVHCTHKLVHCTHLHRATCTMRCSMDTFQAQRKTRRIAQSADPHCTLCTVHCEQWHSTHRTHLHPPPQHWALNSLNPVHPTQHTHIVHTASVHHTQHLYTFSAQGTIHCIVNTVYSTPHPYTFTARRVNSC